MTVLAMPTVVETYKTYDDTNLVKSADVGQMLVVGGASDLATPSGEAADGVTPPMRNVHSRLFRKQLDVSADIVNRVEYDLLTILGVSERAVGTNPDCLPRPWHTGAVAASASRVACALNMDHLFMQGGAPEGLKFVDYEEEWQVDAATGQGRWVPVKR